MQARREVWEGTRSRTLGGLSKKDLTRNTKGKIVSIRKSNKAKELKNLGKYILKKGDKRLRKPLKPKPKKSNPVYEDRTKVSVENIIPGKRIRKPRKL